MDEKELEALFSILKEDTGISTKESLSHIISQGGIEGVYDEIQEGIFNDVETFVGAFNSLKKKGEGSESESGTSDGSSYEPLSTSELEGLIPGSQQVQIQKDASSTEIGSKVQSSPFYVEEEARIQKAKDEEAALIRSRDTSDGSSYEPLSTEELEGLIPGIQQKQIERDASSTEIGRLGEAEFQNIRDEEAAEVRAKIRQETEKVAGPERIKREKEQQKLLEETKQFVQSEEFQQELESIDLEAETALSDLHNKYNKYGFTFNLTNTHMGNDKYGISARSSNGELINISTDDDQALKDFIVANAEISKEVKDEDFLTKAFNVRKSRRGAMSDEDGYSSTVRMASADNVAFPTIFPKDPYSKSQDPADWHVFDVSTKEGMKKAKAMAEERGEIYQFNTDEEADDFAEGAWKESSIEDIEGEKFFKDNYNLDYRRIMDADRRYQEVHSEIEFMKEQLGLSKQAEWNPLERKMEATHKPSEGFIKENPEIYLPNGDIRSDVGERIGELEQEYEKLRKVVVGDKKNQEAIEEFNRFLMEKSEKLAVVSAKQNKEVKEDLLVLNENMSKALEKAGINTTVVDADGNESQRPIDEITQEELLEALKKNPKLYDDLENYNLIKAGINGKQKLASDNYYLGTTYFDRKTRKHIETEFVDDWASVTSQWDAGKARGNAAAMLIGMSLGIENLEDLDVKKLSEHLSKQGGVQGRAFSRYMNANDYTDKYYHALLSDPVEIIGSLMANSLGMLLPIGTEIVSSPKMLAGIAAVGGVYGYAASTTGNPFAVAGATAVGVFSSLQASVSFAMELENSILEAAEDAGFDMSDPVQAQQALASKEVWKVGMDIGVKRGLSIAAVELITAGMAGKVFKVGKTATKAKQTSAFLAERMLYDPVSEGFGEAAALVVSGQGFDLNQVLDESLGGLGSNATTGSVALFMQANKRVKVQTAFELTERDAIARSSASFAEVSKFATNMHSLGQIDESVNNSIQENLVLREEARELLGLSKKEKSNDVVSRTMDLLKAQETLSKNDNSKKIYKDELQKIGQEMSYMVKEGKLAPDDMTTDIGNIKDSSGVVIPMDNAPKSYKINGRRYTKADFKRKYAKMSDKKKKKATFDVKNDPDFNAEIKQEAGVMPTATTATPTTTATTVDAAVDADVTAIAEQNFESIDAVPADIREAATVIEQQPDGTFQVNDENYATLDAVPQEVMASDAVITQKQDGSVDVKYNEDKFIVEAAPITETFETMEQIPQTIKDAASTQIVENDKGGVDVTYKEVEVLGQVMGKQKSEPRFRAKEKKKAKADIEKRRKAELKEWKRDTGDLNAAWAVGSTQTIKEHINAKYAAELAALDSQTKTLEKDGKQETTKKPVAGNRLFNEPLQDATKIADRITKRKGIDTPRNEKIKKLNKERATKIAEAYEKMEHRPNDPEVREAYNTLIDETIEQYEAIIEEGYAMEINNDDSYGNSKEMIEDLKDRKRMKVFSTESGFGSDGITDEMRKDNPMLAKTEYKDANGVPLLVNDIFRFVHDFFGHAKQGNGFGPLGEENAWNIHSQMYSPTARKALTTETRGQNSWVNFSKVNEEAFKIRDEARALRKVGKLDEALKKVEEAYAMMKFAEQKIGLLPDEYTNTDAEIDSSDPQLQLDTELDTESKKKELKEQAIQQMEEVLPERAETIEEIPKKGIPVKVKENTKLADKLKKVGLDFLIGKTINLVMADQLKVSKKYMGGPFFPLIKNLFGKVAWASMNNTAAGSIVNGAMKSDYSVVYNMSPKAIFSNTALRQEILSNLSPEQQNQLYDLIKNDKKFKKTNKSKALLEKSNNLKEMFDLIGSKEINFDVADKIKFFENLIPSKTVEATSPIFSFMQKNGLNLEQILPNVQEQFAGDLPMGALTMIVEVRTKETKTYNTKNDIPSEIKNDPSTKIKKTSDNKLEVTSDRRIKDVVSEIESDVKSGKINKKEGEKRKNEAKKNAILSKAQQKKEGLKSHPNYAIYIRGKAVSMLKETLPFWDIIKSYKEVVSKKIAGEIKDRDSYSVTRIKFSGMGKDAKALVRVNEDGSRNIEVRVKGKNVKEFNISKNNKVKTETYIESNIGKIEKFKPGKTPSIKQAQSGAMGSAMVGASRQENVIKPLQSTYETFIDRLSKALPGIEVVTSQKEFDALMNNLFAKKLINKNQKVYGAVYNGKLYLNPSVRSFNTPIHEFGHIWTNTIKELNTELYNKGMSLVEKSEYVTQIKKSKQYKKITDQMKKEGASDADIKQYILEEALATAIGDKGESFANAAQERNFKGWLTDLFNFVKKLTGISELSANQVQELTLDQFLEGVVVDLLSDNELFKKAEVKNLSNQLQLMTPDSSAVKDVKDLTDLQNLWVKNNAKDPESFVTSIAEQEIYNHVIDFSEKYNIPLPEFIKKRSVDLSAKALKDFINDLAIETGVKQEVKAEVKEEVKAEVKEEVQAEETLEEIAESGDMERHERLKEEKAEAEVKEEVKEESLPNKLPLMTLYGSKMSLDQLITKARQEGFSDGSIKEYLKSMGYKAAEINPAMTIQLDINTKMPEAFTNVFGGARAGIEMFNDIKKDLDNWLKSRWGKGKSFTEYRFKAMELLADHDLYKAQKPIDQQKLMSGMDTVIGRRKAKDVNAPIRSIKDTVKLIKNNNWKGDIAAVKKGLNQATTPLKGTKIHGKNQKKIAALIKGITKDNIDTKIKEIDAVLSDIMQDNKDANTKVNNDISEINKKIQAFSQGQTDRSKTIKEVAALVKGLTKGTRFGAVFGEMASTIAKINDSNVDVKFDKLLGLVTDFYTLQQMSVDKVTGLETAIKNLKEKVKQHKMQARELASIKLKVAQDIKKATQQLRDLGVKEYRYSAVQKLVYKVNNAKIENIDKVLAQIADVFATVEEKGRKKKSKDIKAFVKNAAKYKKRSGRRVGKDGVSADGQAFFDAATKFLEILEYNTVEQVMQALSLREVLGSYTKEQREDALANDVSIKEYVKIIKALDNALGDNPLLASIPDVLLGIDTMTLEELNALALDLKGDKMAFAVQLAEKKAIEKDARDARNAQASEQIQESHEILYNKETVDGETVMTPKNSDELKRIKNPIKKIFKEEGVRAMFRAMLDRFKLSNYTIGSIGHLKAICSVLDNLPAGKNFFTENIVNRLNRANSRFAKGLQDQKKKLDSLAQSINPKMKYDKIKNKIFKTVPLKIGDITYSGDQLVRLYALLKNDVQREKLMKQNGFTLADIENINNSLDPDVKAFADMVVEYLTNEYYEQTNNVYRDVNNINLPKIDNYFPTQTITDKSQAGENIKALAEMATGKVSAQGESFLKQRTNTKGAVAMMRTEGTPYTFTESLDTLMEGAERFKAYASDAKKLNALLSGTEVKNLMKMTGLQGLVNMFINNAVQPVSAKDHVFNSAIKQLFSNFIGVKLGFKLWQIPKQASSAVMAFPDYENNLTKSLPKIVKLIPDLAMFLGELAVTMIDYRQYKEAYNTSPMFRERVNRFRKSGFSSLETTITEAEAKNMVTKVFKNIKKAGESVTFLGDVMGVIGYWANYKRDIKNGMDPQLALEKFENYNSTQQTQRATEINRLQLASKSHPLLMALTTFASTPFLMTSLILESVNNINKQVKKATGIKKPVALINGLFNSKDGIKLMFALGVGNAMFAAVSNVMKLIYGTREDEEDFEKEITKAALGYNTFASLPLVGSVVEGAYKFYQGENVYGSQDAINPAALIVKELAKSAKKEKIPFLDLFHNPKIKDPLANVLFKYATGINTDPMIGVYQYIQGEKGAGFKSIGITTSYLAKEQKSILEGGEIIDLKTFEE